MYKPQLSSILVALGLLLLSTCIGILKPWPIALLLDYILGDNPLPDWVGSWGKTFREQTLFLQIFLCSLSVFVIYFLTSILTSIQNYVVIRIGLKGLRQIRQRLFGWMQTLSLSYFLNQKHGDMIYKNGDVIERAQGYLIEIPELDQIVKDVIDGKYVK